VPQYVSFDNPPVVEVVLGVRFDARGKFKIAHIGAFWATLRNTFPTVEDAPPLIRGEPNLQAGIPPRTWLVTSDGGVLIQIQSDWFLLNWKKSNDSQPYPSYEVVKREFDGRFAEFLRFLEGERINISYSEFELTYVNHISDANGLSEVGECALLIDHLRSTRKRFLPSPSEINWRTSYLLPNGCGRLNIIAQTGVLRSTGERLVRLDLQALGAPGGKPEDQMHEWFDMAHEWVTRGFADITVPRLHKIWERTL
jgi:uncharacterized protein (TIGR04255 family)